MESSFARENLSLATMDKVRLLSIGHGQITEKSFYELLQLNSVPWKPQERTWIHMDSTGGGGSDWPQFLPCWYSNIVYVYVYTVYIYIYT